MRVKFGRALNGKSFLMKLIKRILISRINCVCELILVSLEKIKMRKKLSSWRFHALFTSLFILLNAAEFYPKP